MNINDSIRKILIYFHLETESFCIDKKVDFFKDKKVFITSMARH
jgi:hypothetical protein